MGEKTCLQCERKISFIEETLYGGYCEKCYRNRKCEACGKPIIFGNPYSRLCGSCQTFGNEWLSRNK